MNDRIRKVLLKQQLSDVWRTARQLETQAHNEQRKYGSTTGATLSAIGDAEKAIRSLQAQLRALNHVDTRELEQALGEGEEE